MNQVRKNNNTRTAIFWKWKVGLWYFKLNEIIYLCKKTNAMKAIEFKSKISNNKIQIPKKVQSELRIADDKNVRVMVFLDDTFVSDADDLLKINSTEEADSLSTVEIESINQGLKDFEEGRTHSHEAARKLYEKYL